MGYLLTALAFLIQVVFGIYIFLLMLRFLLYWARVDFTHPISQFVYTLTNPPLRPLHKFIPQWRGLDFATLLLMLFLQMCEIFLRYILLSGYAPALTGLIVLSFATLLQILIYVYIFAILIQVVLSWVAPNTYNPLTVFLHRLTEPLLGPARRQIPPISGFDLSPLIVLLGLQLLLILLVAPLSDMGTGLTGLPTVR